MNNFNNAYNAAIAIDELNEFLGHRNIGLSISSSCSIIQNDIDNVSFERVMHDEELQSRLKAVSNLGYYISAAAHSVARESEKGLVEIDRLKRQLSVLFRCVSDIQSDLDDEERHSWGDNQHWSSCFNAKRKYEILREEQGEL